MTRIGRNSYSWKIVVVAYVIPLEFLLAPGPCPRPLPQDPSSTLSLVISTQSNHDP
jgi:hypothetical protein